MTPLRRNLPLFAPRVSSRAVGRTRPIPNRPRVARSRYGSSFQTILAEGNLPIRVFENDAKPRLNEERGRVGSTYLSAVGIAGSLSESGSVDREIVDYSLPGVELATCRKAARPEAASPSSDTASAPWPNASSCTSSGPRLAAQWG